MVDLPSRFSNILWDTGGTSTKCSEVGDGVPVRVV
jgi:hypothetical protein